MARAVAVRLARDGASIAICARRRDRLDVIADAIARAIEHPVPEVFPHFTSRALVWLNALAPGVCHRVVKKFGRKPIR